MMAWQTSKDWQVLFFEDWLHPCPGVLVPRLSDESLCAIPTLLYFERRRHSRSRSQGHVSRIKALYFAKAQPFAVLFLRPIPCVDEGVSNQANQAEVIRHWSSRWNVVSLGGGALSRGPSRVSFLSSYQSQRKAKNSHQPRIELGASLYNSKCS